MPYCAGKMFAVRVPALDLAPALPQEEDRVVVIRFGHDWEESCMQMDEVLRCWLICVCRMCCGQPSRTARIAAATATAHPTSCLVQRCRKQKVGPPLSRCWRRRRTP